MKRKFLTTLIFLTLVCLLLLAACNTTQDEVKVYDYLVTFDYNVESVGLDSDNYTNSYLGVAKDSKIIAPGEGTDDKLTQHFKETAFADYYVEGWYLPKTDEDGNTVFYTEVKKDENGNDVKDDNGDVVYAVKYAEIDTKWDFSVDTVDKEITLYAKLVKKPTLTVVVLPDTSKNYVRSGLPGDLVQSISSSRIPKVDGYTYLGLYADEACTEDVSWPITLTDDNQNIYAKYIEGTWQVASDAATFNSGITNKMNIYVTADIDFSETAFVAMQECNSEINGNGHKLTGISFSTTTARQSASGFGLFSRLGASANIHDLTIENATFTVTEEFYHTSVNAALFAYTIDPSAKLANLTVSGKVTCYFAESDMQAYKICTNVDSGSETDFNEATQATNCDFENIVCEVTAK